MSKENRFKVAKDEVNTKSLNKRNEEKENIFTPPIQKRENKEQMSIMLTPTAKNTLRELADEANMSASELIAYWIDMANAKITN